MTDARKQAGFTLIEILMVMAIIGILVAIIVAALGPARAKARQSLCLSNLRQIAVAISLYRDDYNGKEPVPNQPASCVDLGLPCQNPHGLGAAYHNNRQIFFCPDFHGFFPNYNEQEKEFTTTYMWGMSSDVGVPAHAAFSGLIARQGDQTPIVVDENHNPPLDLGRAPAWETKQIILLRLSGQVQTKRVPVRSTRADGW